jgi:hypothetical protein
MLLKGSYTPNALCGQSAECVDIALCGQSAECVGIAAGFVYCNN